MQKIHRFQLSVTTACVLCALGSSAANAEVAGTDATYTTGNGSVNVNLTAGGIWATGGHGGNDGSADDGGYYSQTLYGSSTTLTQTATSLNTSGNTPTALGNVSATTTITGSGVVINAAGAFATQIGGAGSGAVTLQSGTASANLANNAASMAVSDGGSFNANATTATVRAGGTGALATNGTDASAVNAGINGAGSFAAYNSAQTIANNSTISNQLNGVKFVNKISGNTLVDGNMYINGTLNYVSNTTANTTVSGGGSILNGATQSTAGRSAIVNAGQTATFATTDSNGTITVQNGTAAQSSASLTQTNGLGNTHGIVIQENSTTLSGGTHSTNMVIDDRGVTLSNAQTGAPVKVTGVADGTTDFDAVNYRQMRAAYRGVAGVAAMNGIAGLDQGKTFALGVGVGGFKGQQSLALGAQYRLGSSTVVRANVSVGTGDNVYSMGANHAW